MDWNKYFQILGALLCAFPCIWELTNDKNGDAHVSHFKMLAPYVTMSKKVDVIARVGLTIAVALFNYYVNDINAIRTAALAAGVHFFFFDYIIAYLLISRKIIDDRFNNWFSYLGSKGLDNFHYWKTMDPVGRLVLRILVLALSLIIYFK